MQSSFDRLTLSICAACALLIGCGAPQSSTGAPGVMPQIPAPPVRASVGKSWIVRKASAGDLLYVADNGGGVIIYAYRPQIKYVGYLSSPQNAEGECVDKAQDIFITDSADEILEYAHGGTSPIAVLNDPYETPLNCAVDPITGNLAVVGYPLEGGSYGVAIYKHARGKPTFYADAGFGDYECGYDNKGNLFIDGYVYSGQMNFAELAKGQDTFENIALNQSFHAAGGIQWDGQHLAVGDLYQAMIYQFDISGRSGTEVGSISLEGSGTIWQFFIDGNKVIAPSTFFESSGSVSIYDYPAGGVAKQTRNVYSPEGVVVSRAPK